MSFLSVWILFSNQDELCGLVVYSGSAGAYLCDDGWPHHQKKESVVATSGKTLPAQPRKKENKSMLPLHHDLPTNQSLRLFVMTHLPSRGA
jgi:hypothetical protein